MERTAMDHWVDNRHPDKRSDRKSQTQTGSVLISVLPYGRDVSCGLSVVRVPGALG